MRSGSRTFLSILTVFGTVWLCLRFLFPLFSPFVVGLVLALIAEPGVSFLHKRLHLPRSVSSGIGVSMTFCLLAMVLLILCAFLVRELGALAGVLPDLEQAARSGVSIAQDWLLAVTDRAPQSLRPLLHSNVTGLFSNGTALLESLTGWLLSLAGSLLSHVPDSALSLGTAVISGYMFSAKLPRIRRWLLRRIPRERLKSLLAAAVRVRKTLGSWLAAQGKLMAVTFGILVLGLTMLRIPHSFLWALGICLVDVFPVLGTGTVLLPWSALYLLQGDTPRALGILGIYTVITLTRSTLEPKLLGRHLGLDPLVTLMALYAGYRLWGFAGMFLAPLLAVTAIQLVAER